MSILSIKSSKWLMIVDVVLNCFLDIVLDVVLKGRLRHKYELGLKVT